MGELLSWWLVVQLLGLAVLPLVWRLFGALPDRGYAFARPLGIFLTSYILWIVAIFGVARNSHETMIFIVIVLAALSWWWVTRRPVGMVEATAATAMPGKGHRVSAGSDKSKKGRLRERPPTRHEKPEILVWLRSHVRLIIVEEALFLAAFLLWAFFKAYNPEIIATEKPMEFAFLNGILRSEYFPPLDPWLSGYSISYYYMGYLMMAVLTRLSGVMPSIGFNLMLVLSFALTVTGAFSIVYNLTARRAERPGIAVVTGLLGSFLVAIIGNLQGFLEFFYIRGMGSVAFWKAVGIDNMTQPYVSNTWYPTANWWWWKASRVIGTAGPIGDYTINEFPFFSFMLGDNHPHVLALPYVLMALGLAVSIIFSPSAQLTVLARRQQWKRLLAVWFMPALLLGGLFFLNTWDFPTYTLIAVLAYGVIVYREHGNLNRAALVEVALFAIPITILGVLLFLPFYLSFQSQASGFGIVRVRTQLHHFLIIFGPFLFMVCGFMAVKIKEWHSLPVAVRPAMRSLAITLLIVGVALGGGLVVIQLWTTVTTLLFASLGGVLVSLLLVSIILLLSFALAAHLPAHLSDAFVFIVAIIGCVVILGPEWGYINDNFGGNLSRMNTVFKFHYQGWILLALASTYSIFYVASMRPTATRLSFSLPRLVYIIAVAALIVAGSFYPVMAFYTKANGFRGTPTLDGMAHMKTYALDDYNAIQWLNRNVKGAPVIVEAIGGEYSEYARVSTHTGLPAVQGWGGHEVQWRGNAKGWEARESDVNRIYATTDVNEARNLLRKYSVQYVYVGRLERETRGSDGNPKYSATALGKFATFMDTVYQQGNVAIYRMRD